MNAWTGRKSLKILRPVIKYFACPCPPLYKCQDQWICTKFAPGCIRCTRVLWACELFTARVGGSTMCALGTWEHFLLNPNIHPSVQLRYLRGFNLEYSPRSTTLSTSIVIDHWTSGVGARSGNMLQFPRASSKSLFNFDKLLLWSEIFSVGMEDNCEVETVTQGYKGDL